MPTLSPITAVLTPNRAISRGAFTLLALGQLALLTAWWLRSTYEVLPTPAEVVGALQQLWAERGLAPALLSSLSTSVQALLITAVLGAGIGYASVLPIAKPVAAAVSKGRFLGLVGLTFVFTLVFGGGHWLKVSLLVLGMTVFFATSMVAAVEAIPTEKLDHARTLRMSEWRVVWEVVVLGTADQALEALRQNAAIGWSMLTMVEGLTRSEGGVGAMLLDQNKHLHLPEVFAIQLTILGVGLMQDQGLAALRRLVCPHTAARQAR